MLVFERALVRGGDEHEAAADAPRQRAPPRGDRGRVDGTAHAGELGDGGPAPERRGRDGEWDDGLSGTHLRGERAGATEQHERAVTHRVRSYSASGNAATA